MENSKFEIEVITRLTKIETKLEDFKSIEDKANAAYNIARENEKKLEELKWYKHTTVAAIIGLIVKLVWDLIKLS